MPIFLDTRGHSTLGIGLCARCSRKFPLDELMEDGNSPGLMVCRDDWDSLDPYRLPAREADKLTLPFYRPDLPLDGFNDVLNDLVRITEDSVVRITEAAVVRILE